jgi:hypothetical protein
MLPRHINERGKAMSGAGKLLLEPFQVPDFFADNIDNISVINGVFRCTLYCWQTIPPETEPVRVAVAHVIMPVGSVPEAAAKALKAVTVAAITTPSDVFCTVERPALLS